MRPQNLRILPMGEELGNPGHLGRRPAEGLAARLTDLEIADTTLETKEGMRSHVGKKVSMLRIQDKRQNI